MVALWGKPARPGEPDVIDERDPFRGRGYNGVNIAASRAWTCGRREFRANHGGQVMGSGRDFRLARMAG